MCEEIKILILEKLDVKKVDVPQDSKSSTAIDPCQEISSSGKMVINYTCTEIGCQLMILEIGAPVSVSGIP